MKKFQIIKLDLFPYDIMIVHSHSVDWVAKRLKKYGLELPDEAHERLRQKCLGNTIQLPNRAVLIYFSKSPNFGLVAHEVFHAVWMILATMGVEPSVESEEVYAYMLEYILNKCD